MTDQIITRMFLLLAIFGLVVNALGFAYLIYETVKMLIGV